MIFPLGGGGTSFQVPFLINATYSGCIVATHLRCVLVATKLLGYGGISTVKVVMYALCFLIPSLSLVIIGCVLVVDKSSGFVGEMKYEEGLREVGIAFELLEISREREIETGGVLDVEEKEALLTFLNVGN